MLAIWERWTDGNPALRHTLDSARADAQMQGERRMAVLRTMARLQARGRSPSVRAAIAAGWAALYCSRGDSGERLLAAYSRALAADRTARVHARRAFADGEAQ